MRRRGGTRAQEEKDENPGEKKGKSEEVNEERRRGCETY
jgi:hypothetical protein